MIRDITGKTTTLRTARAMAIVFCSESTIQLVQNKKIPKGDILEFARAAGYYAAKNTSNLIPHCHPVGIDSLKFEFDYLTKDNFAGLTKEQTFRHGIIINGEAKCIGRTGIEMEALTGVSLCALTIYDILKPIDNDIEISDIRLLEKTGGKSDRKLFNSPPSCAILICSSAILEGKKDDDAGVIVKELILQHKAEIKEYTTLPDDKKTIQKKITELVDQDIHYIFTVGGTGLSTSDQTTDAVKEILEKEIDGITDVIRIHGFDRTPLAMVSRVIAGSIKNTTIVTLPGSVNGARECLEAILPTVFHTRKMLRKIQ